MIKVLRRVLNDCEGGQTLIFFAIMLSGLMGVTGVAVEGGRIFVEYRKLQASADMAALIGAQKLPCGLLDQTCQNTALQDACAYAQNNGYGGGWNSGSSACNPGNNTTVTASVPPTSCSPYDFLSYGNYPKNSSCKSASAPTFYDYIEANLSENLGTVPIFNTPITLTAHAVAKHGIGVPADYALVGLSNSSGLNLGGHSTTIEGSAFSNYQVSQGNACGGGFFSSGTVSGVTTDNTDPITFAPFGCGSSSGDATPVAQGSLPPIQDPYAGSVAPPTQSGSFPNCPVCQQSGWWWDGSWHQGGSPSGQAELFPGIYNSLSLGNGDQLYMNPGVYTFTQGIDTNHGSICVYGAPTCDSTTCNQTPVTQGTPAADQWEYTCSMWGFWDASAISGRPAALSTVPTWYDASTGTTTNVPLNGITIYFPAGAGGITEHGNGGKNGGVYPAAPDPCTGTGTYSSSGPAVSFPAGHTLAAGEGFTYPTGAYATQPPHVVPTNPQPQVYPNQDLSLLGECPLSQTYEVWPGEMPKPQHLHFLYWMAPTGNDSTLNGASGQHQYGIWYSPNSNVTIRGAGKSRNGPPWLDGQMVVASTIFGGNSWNTISYRPCGPGSTACGSGTGTQLVE